MLVCIQMWKPEISYLNGAAAAGIVCLLSVSVIHLDWMQPMSRLNEITMWCCERNSKASTPHLVLNIFQCLQWLQPQILQPPQPLVSMPGQCVVLFAPLNLPATFLRLRLRLLTRTLLALILESVKSPIVRKRNFLSRCKEEKLP